MAIFIWAAVSRNPTWGSRLLGVPVLGFIGRVSYSMYLYHLPLLLLLNKYAPAALGGLAFPCYFAIVVGVAAITFRYVEQPFMRSEHTRLAEKAAPRQHQNYSGPTGPGRDSIV